MVGLSCRSKVGCMHPTRLDAWFCLVLPDSNLCRPTIVLVLPVLPLSAFMLGCVPKHHLARRDAGCPSQLDRMDVAGYPAAMLLGLAGLTHRARAACGWLDEAGSPMVPNAGRHGVRLGRGLDWRGRRGARVARGSVISPRRPGVVAAEVWLVASEQYGRGGLCKLREAETTQPDNLAPHVGPGQPATLFGHRQSRAGRGTLVEKS
jgi:hypothetical protein